MKFYHLPYSHYCAKVRVSLLEKDVPFDILPLPGGSTKSDGFLAINPRGKVPVIIDGDTSLDESAVILEYLEDRFSSPSLFPDTPAERAKARWLLHFHDARVGPGVVALFAAFGSGDTETVGVREAIADFEGALAVVDTEIEGEFFLGDRVLFPDCVFALSVWYARFLLPKFSRTFDEKGYSRLVPWLENVERRSSVQAVVQDTKTALRGMGIDVP